MTNEVILMSHGLMAKEILNSAQMILGDQINYPVVSMTPDDGIEGTFNKLDKIIGTLNDAKRIVILADLMGGTPANTAMMLASFRIILCYKRGKSCRTFIENRYRKY